MIVANEMDAKSYRVMRTALKGYIAILATAFEDVVKSTSIASDRAEYVATELNAARELQETLSNASRIDVWEEEKQ